MSDHVYLSPHLDDAIWSCGGLIYQQTQRGERVIIVTICAGEAPRDGLSNFALELHARWEDLESPIGSRREEDRISCQLLGAGYEHLDIPDCIYRQDEAGNHLYPTLQSILGELASAEIGLVSAIGSMISEQVRTNTNLYVPMCFGGHVDHRLTRLAAESTTFPLHYYHELPYAGRNLPIPDVFGPPSGTEIVQPLSLKEIDAWVEGILVYKSQISTFWDDADSVDLEVRELVREWGGIPVIHPHS